MVKKRYLCLCARHGFQTAVFKETPKSPDGCPKWGSPLRGSGKRDKRDKRDKYGTGKYIPVFPVFIELPNTLRKHGVQDVQNGEERKMSPAQRHSKVSESGVRPVSGTGLSVTVCCVRGFCSTALQSAGVGSPPCFRHWTVRYRLLCPRLLFNDTPKCRNASDAGDIFYDKKVFLKTEIL